METPPPIKIRPPELAPLQWPSSVLRSSLPGVACRKRARRIERRDMPEVQTSPTSIEMDLPDEAATAAIARSLAGPARPGVVFTLSGALGTGKTVFARAFIRARGGAS